MTSRRAFGRLAREVAGGIGCRRSRALATLAACAVLLVSCASLEPPKVTLKSVRIDGLSLDGIELVLNMDVSNPNGFGARVGRLKYSVDVDGTEMATGHMADEVFVPAGESAEVAVPFTVTWEGIGKGVDRYLDGAEHRWKLSGSVRVSNGALSNTFRFSEDGEFQSPDSRDVEMDF